MVSLRQQLAAMQAEQGRNGKAMQGLQHLATRYEALLASIPDIITEVDNRKVYTWLNHAGLTFFGQDALGKQACDFFIGDQSTYDRVQPLFEGDRHVIYVESWQRRKDGQKRLLAWHCRALFDSRGKPVGALSSARDITDDREAHEQLRLSADILSLINKPDTGGDILQELLKLIRTRLDVGAAAIRLRQGDDFPYAVSDGFTREFLSTEYTVAVRLPDGSVQRDKDGHIVLDCLCGCVLQERGDPSLSVFTGNGSFWSNRTSRLEEHAEALRKLGHLRNRCCMVGYESLALVPLRGTDGIVGLLHLADKRPDMFTAGRIVFLEKAGEAIGIALARKQSRAQLAVMNAKLTEAVEQLRTTQETMVRQERLRALGRMAGGVAHDLNNLFTPIVGFSDMLTSSPHILDNKREAMTMIREIAEAARDARKVIQRLRSIAGPSGPTDSVPVDLAGIVKEAVEATSPRWKNEMAAQGISITVTAEVGDVPPVLGNATELRQAMINLILNAVDAMPRGGSITIRAAAAGDSVAIEVVDTGVGMDEETRKRCLEAFYTTKTGGGGLGLAIVHGTVERHKGHIEVISKPNKGTSIRIRLPAATGAVPPLKTAAKTSPGRPLNILVIDDEMHVRVVLERFLNTDGHKIDFATSGQDGIDRFRPGTHDLIITDRSMPGMSGDEVAQRLKQIHPGVPIIMLTGFGDLMEDRGEYPSGVDKLISKPVTRDELREAIRTVTRT